MRFKRNLKKDASIDMAPLVDIVFLLLLFFVVTTTFKDNPGLEIDLPETRDAKGIEMKDLVINIVPVEGGSDIYLGEKKVDIASLPAALKMELEKREVDDRSVVVQADKNVMFDTVYQVFDIARQAGATGISLPGEFKKVAGN